MIPPRFLNAVAWLEIVAEDGPLDEYAYDAARMNAAMLADVWFPPVQTVILRGEVTLTFHGWERK